MKADSPPSHILSHVI